MDANTKQWKFTYKLRDTTGGYVTQILDMTGCYVDTDLLGKGLFVVITEAELAGEGPNISVVKPCKVKAVIPLVEVVSAVSVASLN